MRDDTGDLFCDLIAAYTPEWAAQDQERKLKKMAIKLKSSRICERCKKDIPYPYQHVCDPSGAADTEEEDLYRRAAGECV